MINRSEEHAAISYYFGGEFLPYEKLFARHCPPPMEMDRGMWICRPGETQGWMYYLCKGRLRVYTTNCEGNERLVAILRDGSLAGLDCLLPDQASLVTIECITNCRLMPLPSQTISQLIRENPDFAVDLSHYYCKVMRQLCFDAANQSISNILIRLVNFLQTGQACDDRGRVHLSQQQLASAVGCSRTSIARILRLMREEGIIVTEGVGFQLLKPDSLNTFCRKYEKCIK